MAILKKIIKKITPKFIISWVKKIIPSFNSGKISRDYKVLNNPNLNELKNKYNNAWKSQSIPKEQIELTKEQLPNFYNIAPMKAAVDILKKIEPDEKKLLEIGCSSGYYSEVFKRAGFNLNYEGCDYSEAFIELAKKLYPNNNFKACDATALQYDDEQFDIVISGCCILHIIDYKKAIAEAVRVSNKYVIFHRTPMLHNNKTTFLTKVGYGVEMLEIFFNEEELMDLFNKNNLAIKSINTHAQLNVDGINEPVFMKSYLCEKI